MAAALARLIGLPGWLPKAILRAAGVILALAVVFAPDTARGAFKIYVALQTERVMGIMGGVLIDSVSGS